MKRLFLSALSPCLLLVSTPSASARQCELGWINDFGGAMTSEAEAGEPPVPPILDTLTRVGALAVFDPDGEGPLAPRLIVAGQFTHIGGIEANAIAQWDGTSWSALGPGLTRGLPNQRVLDLVVNPAAGIVYVAGHHLSLGGAASPTDLGAVAMWNGSSWSPAGGGLDGNAVSLAIFDDGGGPLLYAAGNPHVLARLEQGIWRDVVPQQALPRPLLRKIVPTSVSGEPALALLGLYSYVDENGKIRARNVMAWKGPPTDPPTWSGAAFMGGGLFGAANTAVSFDEDADGPLPPSLFVGGTFTHAIKTSDGGELFPARDIARWDGAGWQSLGSDPSRQWFARGITALTVHDDGSGPALYAGGTYAFPPTAPINGVARWTGDQWVSVGTVFGHERLTGDPILSGPNPIHDFEVFRDSRGAPSLFAAGMFQYADGLPAAHVARLARPFVRGDANNDASVTFEDVDAVLTNWGATYPVAHTGTGDADADGDVDFNDLTAVLARFGQSCS